MVRHGVGIVMLVYASLTNFLKHRNGSFVLHIPGLKITSNLFAGPTQKEPPKPSLMTMEEVDSDSDPNEDK